MNREILFRGKQADNGEWVYGWLYHDQVFKNGYPCQDVMLIRDECDRDCEVHIETIGQFTGLTDKNGTKIFEGDIIDIHQTVNGCNLFEIVWDKTKWNARYVQIMEIPRLYEYSFDNLMGLNISQNYEEEELEVVGNIHEGREN
jgi:uncharacterized phage protein (TIGR01671 family)